MNKLTQAFSASHVSGLPDGARDDALYHDEEEEEERGHWNYLVIDKEGAVPRRVASYDKSHLLEGNYGQGTVVAVTKRIRRGWTYWLGLRDKAEWLFDVDPADKIVVLMEVTVQDGVKDVVAAQTMQILPRASFDAIGAGMGNIEANDAFKVVQQVSLVSGIGTFWQISNGRGWVLQPPQALQDGGVESGRWDYMAIDSLVVVVPQLGVDPASVSANVAQQTGIEEGTVIQVTERVLTDRTRMLRTPGGWARESLVEHSKKGSRSHRVMMEIPVERGHFVYRILPEKGVAIRKRCSFAENAKAATGPFGGELIEFTERVRCGETTFCKMADGRGWLFDVKNGKRMMEVVEETPNGGLPPSNDCLDLGEGFVLDMKTPRPH
eukprot:gnl/MRDRNA2_/MRDRNA2_90133_c0_seq1.p1 gnl/MRDRNA2_/MRDRNA2_90133_c0~~gnl/MRDRNA2_/MRDRNA2_90133_c0_seq1.p1  ORF type:complete len:380 (+),score=79.92 gnl/MRDRNA2_/MRDRNA2_90133_c0_seq1:92-1231(+)